MNTVDRDQERGERIRYVRVSLLNFRSQQEFAEWLGGVTRGAVGNWERGLDISLDNLTAISVKAQVPFDWLAFGTGDRPPPRKVEREKPHSADDRLARALAAFDELPEVEQKAFLARVLGL